MAVLDKLRSFRRHLHRHILCKDKPNPHDILFCHCRIGLALLNCERICLPSYGKQLWLPIGSHNAVFYSFIKEESAMLYPDRESNSDLLFRRELFYPLNYQSPKKSNAFMSRITMVCSQHEVRCKGKDKFWKTEEKVVIISLGRKDCTKIGEEEKKCYLCKTVTND